MNEWKKETRKNERNKQTNKETKNKINKDPNQSISYFNRLIQLNFFNRKFSKDNIEKFRSPVMLGYVGEVLRRLHMLHQLVHGLKRRLALETGENLLGLVQALHLGVLLLFHESPPQVLEIYATATGMLLAQFPILEQHGRWWHWWWWRRWCNGFGQ